MDDCCEPTTLRLSLRASFRVYVFVGLLVVLSIAERYYQPVRRHPTSQVLTVILDVLLVLMTAGTLLRWWFERLVADETGFVTYNFLNRASRRVEFAAVTAYRPTRLGTWLLFTEGKRVKMPEVELAELHRLMVARAPKALKAKRLRGGLIPPAENFEALGMFDGQDLLSNLLGTLIISLPFCLLAPEVGLIYLCVFMISQMYRLLDLGGRMTLDSEGLHARWPWQAREIRWADANAIFCERIGRERRFVVTSPTTSIVIPRHIAHDVDIMRKVFHSLPAGTLCVNFDDSIRGGWRRGRRRRVRAGDGSPTLEPAFGTGF